VNSCCVGGSIISRVHSDNAVNGGVRREFRESDPPAHTA
jgi:hypothetical protein